MLEPLAESYPRIKQQPSSGDAGIIADGDALLQKCPHFPDHIHVGRFVLHGPRCAQHVHDAGGGVGLGHHLEHVGISQSGHVVHQMTSRLQGEAGYLGFAGIYGDDRIKLTQAFDDRDHTRALVLQAHGQGAGAR